MLTNSCTLNKQAPKANNQTLKRSPAWPSQHSSTAARAQKRVRCAAKPNTKPMSAPPAARTLASPQVSNRLARFTVISNNSIFAYMFAAVHVFAAKGVFSKVFDLFS
jgi:hypothetical protein